MGEIDGEYDAVLVDTSIFDSYALKLEKGLLGKLSQFKRSPIIYLLPDVIKGEIKNHLEARIKIAKSTLEKALNGAGDYLFFEDDELSSSKKNLVDSKEIDGLAESCIERFIESTGALVLETGGYISVSQLLESYFSNKPPFAETGKKKNEFPDAIVLLAVEAWATQNNIHVLAVSQDGDWKNYCEASPRIDCYDDFSLVLEHFNKTNVPYAFLDKLETALDSGAASSFLSVVTSYLHTYFDGFTPDQEANSFLYWEPEGCNGWFNSFAFVDHKFRIVDKDDDWVVLGGIAHITVDVEGEFSLSVHDSIDGDYVNMGGVTATASETFKSEILIKISGDLNGPVDGIDVDEVEVVSPIEVINFGTIQPDYDEYE